MKLLQRMVLRTSEPNEAILLDCLDSAKAAILSRRFPYGDWPTKEIEVDGEAIEVTYVEPQYEDLQLRIAIDLYNKIGAEGELSHSENGISRGYESSWISEQLLSEVTPFVGVAK